MRKRHVRARSLPRDRDVIPRRAKRENRSFVKVKKEEKPVHVGHSLDTTSPLGGFAVTEVGRPCGSPRLTGGSVTRRCARSGAPRSRPYSTLFKRCARFLLSSVAAFVGGSRDTRGGEFATTCLRPTTGSATRDNARDATARLPASRMCCESSTTMFSYFRKIPARHFLCEKHIYLSLISLQAE